MWPKAMAKDVVPFSMFDYLPNYGEWKSLSKLWRSFDERKKSVISVCRLGKR